MYLNNRTRARRRLALKSIHELHLIMPQLSSIGFLSNKEEKEMKNRQLQHFKTGLEGVFHEIKQGGVEIKAFCNLVMLCK